jgi:hypothetical protein
LHGKIVVDVLDFLIKCVEITFYFCGIAEKQNKRVCFILKPKNIVIIKNI